VALGQTKNNAIATTRTPQVTAQTLIPGRGGFIPTDCEFVRVSFIVSRVFWDLGLLFVDIMK